MRNYFCQYRYRNLNACKFHLERHVEYSTGPTADRTNVTLVRSNVFSRAGNTFPWTSASLKITFMESTYPGQRPQSLSLSPHFLLHICIFENGLNVEIFNIGTFRSDYEIECEYDFLNLVLMHWIVTFYINLVPIVSFSTGQQQGGVIALRT